MWSLHGHESPWGWRTAQFHVAQPTGLWSAERIQCQFISFLLRQLLSRDGHRKNGCIIRITSGILLIQYGLHRHVNLKLFLVRTLSSADLSQQEWTSKSSRGWNPPTLLYETSDLNWSWVQRLFSAVRHLSDNVFHCFLFFSACMFPCALTQQCPAGRAYVSLSFSAWSLPSLSASSPVIQLLLSGAKLFRALFHLVPLITLYVR